VCSCAVFVSEPGTIVMMSVSNRREAPHMGVGCDGGERRILPVSGENIVMLRRLNQGPSR
jgi:hypothetical protein